MLLPAQELHSPQFDQWSPAHEPGDDSVETMSMSHWDKEDSATSSTEEADEPYSHQVAPTHHPQTPRQKR